MRVPVVFAVVLGLAAERVSAGWRDARSFSTPDNSNAQCSSEQSNGYDWSGLNAGSFSSYGSNSFSGWSCSKSSSKRDYGRGNFQSTCITANLDDKPSISCHGDDQMSIKEYQVSSNQNQDFEALYGMPDGSVCTEKYTCHSEGSIIQNTQCGGAKNVTFQAGGGKSSGCTLEVHSIGFSCSSSTSSSWTVPSTSITTAMSSFSTQITSTTAQTTSSSSGVVVQTSASSSGSSSGIVVQTSASSSSSTTSSGIVVETSATVSSDTTSSGIVVETSATLSSGTTSSGIVVETSATLSSSTTDSSSSSLTTPALPIITISASSPTFYSRGSSSYPESSMLATLATTSSGKSTSTTTAFSTSTIYTTNVRTITSCAASVTNCPANSGSVVFVTDTYVLSTTICPVTAASQTSSSATPGPTAPGVLPSCLNTWMHKTDCKDNGDFDCYCKSPDFITHVMGCVDSWSTSHDDTQAAVTYLMGICAPYVAQNPAIITAAPSDIAPGAPPASTETLAPSTITLWSTVINTITSCAPDVTDCPASSTPVTVLSSIPIATSTVDMTTPVAPTTGAAPGFPSATIPYTTLSIASVYTIPATYCSGVSWGLTIPGSSTTTSLSTIVTVPQVALTTSSDDSEDATTTDAVGLQYGTQWAATPTESLTKPPMPPSYTAYGNATVSGYNISRISSISSAKTGLTTTALTTSYTSATGPSASSTLTPSRGAAVPTVASQTMGTVAGLLFAAVMALWVL